VLISGVHSLPLQAHIQPSLWAGRNSFLFIQNMLFNFYFFLYKSSMQREVTNSLGLNLFSFFFFFVCIPPYFTLMSHDFFMVLERTVFTMFLFHIRVASPSKIHSLLLHGFFLKITWFSPFKSCIWFLGFASYHPSSNFLYGSQG